MSSRTGFVGLGAMGLAMAKALYGAGMDPLGFDSSTSSLGAAKQAGLRLCENVQEVFEESDIIVLSLPAAAQVRSVVEKSGLLSSEMDRKVIVDTSTSETDVSRELSLALALRGHGFLDAPVSGGPLGAANGSLTFMIGGDEATMAEAMPQLEIMGSKLLHVGPNGAGNVAKLVNNMLVACHMLTTAEGLRLAKAAGVEVDDALRVVNAASGRTMLSENHFPNYILSERYDSGFSTALMRKDVRLALDLAQQCGLDLPLALLASNIWSEDASEIADDADFTQFGNPDLKIIRKTKAVE